MLLLKLSIDDFRGIRHAEIDLDPKMTVVVGRNGVGKTSILDAIAGLLLPVQMMIPRDGYAPVGHAMPFTPSDRRYGKKTFKLELAMELTQEGAAPAVYSLGHEFDLSRQGQFSESLSRLWNAMAQGARITDERFAIYYRQDRGFAEPGGVQDPLDLQQLLSGSLFGNLRAIKDLESWWDRLDAQEAREARDSDINHRDPQLEAIRHLIREIDGFVGIRYIATASPAGLYLAKEDDTLSHVSQLSAGERSFIILLADLARRLQIRWPQKKLADMRGLILIDEIELNLHPAWQSKILPTLSAIFSSCQFIVTTHSPQVVSSVQNQNVRVLTSQKGVLQTEIPLSTKGRTSNYLLEGVFGASERSPEIDKMFADFNDAIDARDLERARNLLKRIVGAVDGDPPELVTLRNRLRKISGAE